MAINDKMNYDDVFLRDLTTAVLANLENKISWTNNFESGPVDVDCKIYYSLTGSDNFLLDNFTDDIVGNQRFVELNTDAYPRGHVTLKSWNVRSGEFANPNVWLRMVVENQDEIKNVLSNVRALPITASFELNLLLNSELDTFKASQSIMNALWLYKHIYFEHNFMYIDAILNVPDDFSVEITRDQNLNSENEIRMSINFEVDTYYPAFNPNHSIEPIGVQWINDVKQSKWNNINDGVENTNILKLEFDNDYVLFGTPSIILKSFLPKASKVKLKIYDSMANLVEEMDFNDIEFDIGDNNFLITISDNTKFPGGFYHVKLETDDAFKTIKFQIG